METLWDIKSLKSMDLKSGAEAPIEGLEKSDVIQFFLADGSKITARPSGTEPKIKFYFSVNDQAGSGDMEKAMEGQRKRIDELKKGLLDKISHLV